jgi:hypothetical protein
MSKLFFRVWSVAAVSCVLTITSAFAQETDTATGGAATNQSETDRNDDTDMGWIGLAGLLGLAGLMRRDSHRDVHANTGATTRH